MCDSSNVVCPAIRHLHTIWHMIMQDNRVCVHAHISMCLSTVTRTAPGTVRHPLCRESSPAVAQHLPFKPHQLEETNIHPHKVEYLGLSPVAKGSVLLAAGLSSTPKVHRPFRR